MPLLKARALLGDGKIIGVTAKTVAQAKEAEAGGADYLGSGAVFGTSTKQDAKRMDHALLDQICESVRIPVVAIGGICSENILELKGRKMNGVAVVSGIFHSDDIEGAARNLRKLAEEAVM
jgi:thiamine-phosphate diphosphorylase